jgi:hypothetical protein
MNELNGDKDPIVLLSRQRIIKLSGDLEAELDRSLGGGIATEILDRLRQRAAESLAALATIDLFTPKGRQEAVSLQNEVKRYDEWFGAMRQILIDGKQYDDEMRDEDREELMDALAKMPDGDKQMITLGLVDPAID